MPKFGEPAAALARFWKMPATPKLDLRKREWIYFLQAADEPSLVKIGRTRGLKWRVLAIQSQCPVALRLIGAVSAPAGTEWILHARFKTSRQHGEWFAPTTELLAFIAALPKGSALMREFVCAVAADAGVNAQEFFDKAAARLGSNGQQKTWKIPKHRDTKIEVTRR